MKRTLVIIFALAALAMRAQTPLTEAVDFHVKTIYGDPIFLFQLLDEEDMIVVLDFFSTTCGPCQDYAYDFQQSYEDFGLNSGNVEFIGINYGNDNEGVRIFDSIFGLTYPTVSGMQGGGDQVFSDYQILAYPTVIVIKPDHEISSQEVWLPTTENINEAVIEAGGEIVGISSREVGFGSLLLYPSPASTTARASFNLDAPAHVWLEMVAADGKTIVKRDVGMHDAGKNTIDMNVSACRPGIYMVLISDSFRTLFSGKLMVSR